MEKSNIEKWDEDVAKNGCITQDQIRCITFDKEAQDSLPQYIKDKMKADREKARNLKRGGLNSSHNLNTCKMLRAKFYVGSIKEEGNSEVVNLSAVYGTDDKDNEENNQFAEATPCGTMEMWVDNPKAKGFFEVGKEYYLDFSPAN